MKAQQYWLQGENEQDKNNEREHFITNELQSVIKELYWLSGEYNYLNNDIISNAATKLNIEFTEDMSNLRANDQERAARIASIDTKFSLYLKSELSIKSRIFKNKNIPF